MRRLGDELNLCEMPSSNFVKTATCLPFAGLVKFIQVMTSFPILCSLDTKQEVY